jgi:hypothetical protein
MHQQAARLGPMNPACGRIILGHETIERQAVAPHGLTYDGFQVRPPHPERQKADGEVADKPGCIVARIDPGVSGGIAKPDQIVNGRSSQPFLRGAQIADQTLRTGFEGATLRVIAGRDVPAPLVKENEEFHASIDQAFTW